MIFKEIIRKIHLWIGMATGLVVFIIAITGCIYVFSEEIKHFVNHDENEVQIPKASDPLPLNILLDKASLVFDNKYPCQRIIVPGKKNEGISFSFEKVNKEAFWYHDYMEFYKTVYVNPYTGEIIRVENTKWEFFNFVFWLHISLLFGYKIGSQIVTWSVILFVFMLISGLVLWWPKRKKMRRSLWFRWKQTTGWRRKNYDLHNIPGFYFLLIGLLLALTGLFWASENFNKSVRWIANGGKKVEEQQRMISDTAQQHLTSSLDRSFSKVEKKNPVASAYMIRIPPTLQGVFVIRAYPGTTNYDRLVYYFDRYSGQLLFTENYSEKNNGDKIAALNYDLHTGSIAGLPTKILAFAASLITASLPITGLVIWLGKKSKNRKKEKRINAKRDKRISEKATIA